MPNHVIRDRLWESRKLADCSRAAAMAYPWIFLIADDHGRFEFHPRRIWTRVFGNRDDVELGEVAAWLSEYARVGLLIRYGPDGGLAYWYKFKGRPPSDRRPSEYADPKDFPVAYLLPRSEPRQVLGDDLGVSYPLTEIERNGSEQNVCAPRADIRADVQVEDAIRKARWSEERELLRVVGRIAEHTGKDPPEVMREVTAYKRRDGSVVSGRANPSQLQTAERVTKSLDDARAWLVDLEKK